MRANGINDAGNIVGYLSGHAFLDSGGTLTQLPDLAGPGAPCCSVTVGINNNNEIAGNSDTSTSGGTHAVAWTNGPSPTWVPSAARSRSRPRSTTSARSPAMQ